MSELNKPNRKKAQTDTSLYLHHLSRADSRTYLTDIDNTSNDKDNIASLPQREVNLAVTHGAFFKPQRPRHHDSMVEPRRNYGLPNLARVER